MPHSNFAEQIDITDEGKLLVNGPLLFDADDDRVIWVVVSAFVTQEPSQHHQNGGRALGATCAGDFTKKGASAVVRNTPRWSYEGSAHGGAFVEGWAWGSAEMSYGSSDGVIEKYIWSQWVWLRRP